MASSESEMAEKSKEENNTEGNFDTVQLAPNNEGIKNDFLVTEENLNAVLENKLKEEIAAQSLILSALSGGGNAVNTSHTTQQTAVSNINVENLMAMKPQSEVPGEQTEQSELNFDVSQAIGVEMIAIQQDNNIAEQPSQNPNVVQQVTATSSKHEVPQTFLNHHQAVVDSQGIDPSLSGQSVVLNAIAIKGDNGVTEIQFEGSEIMNQNDIGSLQSQVPHHQHTSEIVDTPINEESIAYATAEIELPSSSNDISDSSAKYPQLFVATTAQEAHDVVKRYAEETMSTFVSMRKMKQFGITEGGIDMQKKNYRVFFESSDVEFDGIPYVYVADKMYICHLGKDKTEVTRQKIRQQSMERRLKLGLPTKDMSATRLRTKKIDCPVKITVKMIAKFPQYKVIRKTKRVCETASKKVRQALLETNGKLSCYYAFVGRLPPTDEHNHPIGEEKGTSQDDDIKDQENAEHEPIDPLIKDKIIQLTWEGVPSSGDVKKMLEEFVEKELFAGKVLPSRNRRRFFPNVKDIRNYMNKAKMLTRLSSDIKEELQLLAVKLQQNRPTENIILQSELVDSSHEALLHIKTTAADETAIPKPTLIFCHQTSQQQRLLKRYGSTITICEVTNLVERVPFPLICVFVQTNVDFQLIASFIVEIRNKESLVQGLNTVKEWNPSWSPKYVILDYSEEQTEAVKAVFPSKCFSLLFSSGQGCYRKVLRQNSASSLFISEESRERSWRNWLTRPENKIHAGANQVFHQFQAIANAYNEDVLHQAALQLENSDVWRESANLRSWFNSNWLLEAKKWVIGYRPDDFIVTLHNDSTIDQDIRCLREAHMSFMRGKKLGSLIEKLVDRIIPDFYRRYIELNRKSYTQANELKVLYGDQLPTCLVNKPAAVIMHVLDQIKSTEATVYQVSHVQPGVFWIQDASHTNGSEQAHTVSFGDANTLPACDCLDWQRFKLPCKHLCSVFSSFPDWGWDMLNASYTANPLINLDYSCIKPWVDAQDKQEQRLTHFSTAPTFNLRGNDAKTTTARLDENLDKVLASSDIKITGVELEVPVDSGSDDKKDEKAANMLPLVEGDELSSIQTVPEEQRNVLAVQCRDLLQNLSQLSAQFGNSDQFERLKSDLQASIGMLKTDEAEPSNDVADEISLETMVGNKRYREVDEDAVKEEEEDEAVKKLKLEHEKSDSSIDESYVSEEEQVGIPVDEGSDVDNETLEITTGHQMDELEASTPPRTPEVVQDELTNEEVPIQTILTRPVSEETPEQRERKLLAILTASTS